MSEESFFEQLEVFIPMLVLGSGGTGAILYKVIKELVKLIKKKAVLGGILKTVCEVVNEEDKEDKKKH